MVSLLPMPQEAFPAFAEDVVAGYAQDNIIAGRWQDDRSLEHARSEFALLLPQGRLTPDHYFYEIRVDALDVPVGSLWFAVVASRPDRTGYIYNIRVKPAFRGKGYAKAALEQIEDIAAGMGLGRISLHVFGFNLGAQALYRSLGYGITGMNMLKPLRKKDA